MIYSKWRKYSPKALRGLIKVNALAVALCAAANADDGLTKTLAPYAGLLTKSAVGLAVLLVGLIAWEVIESKRASRSSLDIAKLAAAAAKKKANTAAPASGNLEPSSRSFAPPPPPPPSTSPPPPPETKSAPPPPPPTENPFAAPMNTGAAPMAPATPATPNAGMGVGPVDSTVAFNPPDASSSGGWADLLQRVRAGEPEAASFSGDAPPPSTEGDVPAVPPSPFGAPPLGESPAFDASPAPTAPLGEPSSSSEAWEALLKRTTTSDTANLDAPPSQDSGRISLGSSFFNMPEEKKPEDPKGLDVGLGAPKAPPSSFQLPSGGTPGEQSAPPAPPAGGLPSFQMPGSAPPAGGTPSGFQLPGSSMGESGPGFQMPSGGGSEAPTSSFQFPSGGGSEAPTSSFQFPTGGGSDAPTSSFQFPTGGGSDAPTSSFQMPGAAASAEGPPSFKLPGGDAGGGGGGGFQMPGSGDSNPFGSIDDPSSTLPLSDMFNSGGSQAPPSFQLPSLGSQPSAGGGNPFDFSGGGSHDAGPGRTISLDFSQGSGQIPPPPQPKTEG